MTPTTRVPELEDTLLRVTAMALDAVYGAMERVEGDAMRHMPKFRHVCKPCGACDSTGVIDHATCSECEGRSSPCDCLREYDDEGSRRYERERDREC